MAGGVRITGGERRGRVLSVGPGVRPTEGRVRESLFSIWQDRVRGARFLDLFAGSGAVGLEAHSRGAAFVCFVEADPRVLRDLERNAAELPKSAWRRWRGRVPAALGQLVAAGEPAFDLVFADPPYAFEDYEKLIAAAAELLAENGEVAVEHSARTSMPEATGDLRRADERRYGETALSFYRRGEAPRQRPA
jgi:16S rRNA (guanine(966)-N(2))-methyltransferase RsmD